MGAKNVLYYGDNLKVLRDHVAAESVDLVYLDPPFNSNADYNVLFAEKDGTQAASQIKAFGDTWHWEPSAALAFQEIVEAGGKVSQCMQAFRTLLGENDMLAYLSMMAPRLMELRRVLKPTGSVYLHCDPTASHYLKLLMDAVFGAENFRNEIVWHYYNKFQRGDIPMFANDHDIIFFYTKQPGGEHNFKSIYEEREKPTQQLARKWDAKKKRIVNVKDEDGHVVYRTVTHRKIDDVWRMTYIVPASKEGLGYPTQKPEALLERILNASSNEGDMILDPFCGCGTTIAAAQKMGRNWIGIDITHLATGLIKSRLLTGFGLQARKDYAVVGEPEDLASAEQLAKDDAYEFQWWAVTMVGVSRGPDQKKGADKGIDGRLYFHDEQDDEPRTTKKDSADPKLLQLPSPSKRLDTKQVIFSVKSGNTNVAHVRDLRGVLDREKAQIGVLITMQESTQPMRTEAASAGFYKSFGGSRFPRIQILTVRELLDGRKVEMPAWHEQRTFKAAPKAKGKAAHKQADMFDQET